MAWRCAALVGAAPERSPLAATARAHLSSGAALACVLAPRLWHGYRARSLAQEVGPVFIHAQTAVLCALDIEMIFKWFSFNYFFTRTFTKFKYSICRCHVEAQLKVLEQKARRSLHRRRLELN